jgi:hypothetical protein
MAERWVIHRKPHAKDDAANGLAFRLLSQVLMLQTPSLPATTERCIECGGSFPFSELIPFADFRVCAQCKPAAVRKLESGQPIGALFQKGRLVIAMRGAALPDRCVKCNCDVGEARVRRKLYWHPSGWYLLILLNILIYALISLAVRKRAEILVGLCDRHRQKRWNAILGGWGLVLGGIASVVFGATQDLPIFFLVGIVAFLGGVFWGIFGSRIVVAQRIDETTIHLGGICAAFRAALPPWHGA